MSFPTLSPDAPHVSFDFDGVFVDSFREAYETTKIFNEGLGEDQYRELFMGNVYDGLKKRALTSVHGALPAASDPYFRHFIPKMLALSPVEGMPELVRSLAATHSLSVVSSSIETAISLFLEMHGMRAPFRRISGACAHKKKTVKIRRMLRAYAGGRPNRAVFVTDTAGDVHEAHHVGVRSIAVSWGFHSEAMLRAASPYAVVHTPAELEATIRNAF